MMASSSSPSTLKLHHGFGRGRHSPDFTPEMRDRQARGKDPTKVEELDEEEEEEEIAEPKEPSDDDDEEEEEEVKDNERLKIGGE